MVTYYTEPDTTDHDAMVLLDLIGSQPTPRAPISSPDVTTSSST
ncbi:hypothetical protein ACFY3G_45520 [Streptomyces phaeochromogenes]